VPAGIDAADQEMMGDSPAGADIDSEFGELGGHSVLDATTGSPVGMGMEEALQAIYGHTGHGDGDSDDGTDGAGQAHE